MSALRSLASLMLGLGLLAHVMAFDRTRMDNLAVYWGQDGANSQQRLSFYCQDDTIDIIPLAFLYIFRGTGGEPVIDFANTCNQWDDTTFSGTDLANCQTAMASDIKTCQSKGKLVTLSLGGATGQVGFSSDSQAESFATQIWNLFLGGSSPTRPFGKVVLDGIDLDIESGSPAHYAAFVKKIKSLAAPTGKSYYITAAPQCPYPDANIGDALNAAPFDAVFVQFYNNYCGLDAPSEYNFATWDNWAKTKSANKNIKVFIGAPASKAAAGTGYVDSATLAKYASDAQAKYSSFGGVMMWDADTAYTNGRFDKSVKTFIVASAEKLGAPAPKKGGSPSPVKTNTVTPTHATATHTSTVKPVPTRPAFKQPVFAPHQTEDSVAIADGARYEKGHQVDDPNDDFDDAPEDASRINSRFFRL
ncbi:glycoside hydrolase superfamily [Irpex rosettiformis]|uniref:Glycoside hydrolase superfamily n=1 Tax=Irpex rosettiformis TaxID=378272 RepID=A0ACB8UAM0_9APHY|nr:glycoside hydrolase superfamily [Irpex rosettiformis]